MRVGRRLQKSAEALVKASVTTPCKEAVVGLDGGYVRARHRRPERNFEIVAGKILAENGSATRFAFVRQGGEGVRTAELALVSLGVNHDTSLTVLTDGDAGLRAIHHQLAPQAEHVLDWFHISMRFQNLKQVAKGIHGLTDGALRGHALDQLERAKWRCGMVRQCGDLSAWCTSDSGPEPVPSSTSRHSLRKLGYALLDVIRSLELNADSMPDYGQRYRSGSRISTGFAESAVNEIISKRMAKKQQMTWNRYTVQHFLDVRIQVLDGSLEDAFRYWHKGFRPTSDQCQEAAAA